MTIREIASYLQVAEATVAAWVGKGVLASNEGLITKDDLAKFLKERRVGGRRCAFCDRPLKGWGNKYCNRTDRHRWGCHVAKERRQGRKYAQGVREANLTIELLALAKETL